MNVQEIGRKQERRQYGTGFVTGPAHLEKRFSTCHQPSLHFIDVARGSHTAIELECLGPGNRLHGGYSFLWASKGELRGSAEIDSGSPTSIGDTLNEVGILDPIILG